MFFSILFMSVVVQLGMAQADLASSTRIHKGDLCPQFTFVNEEGMVQSIMDYRGKHVLLVFFATWCGPCLDEMEELNKAVLPECADSALLEVLFIGRSHTLEEVQSFKKKHAYTTPYVGDPEREIYRLFADKYIPRSFLVGEDGHIEWVASSYNGTAIEELKRILKKIHQ